ncbi:MAG: hypothetical protein QF532_11820 [Acidimicrobiales bacterium]|jgi:hypothetical protein|nr:hypothetical protein [Acidimicrobiales bacterium]
MTRFVSIPTVLVLLALLPAQADAKEFPEVDVSIRWSTVGAFEPEMTFFADRHYVDRLNPEVGVHLLPFLDVTVEYIHAQMLRRTTLAAGDYDTSMTARLRTDGFAVGARLHPNWRGVLLPFARVVFGLSRGEVTFDAPEGGFHGYWKESSTRPELTLSGGTEILFPRGVRERSHQDLGGKVNRAIRNGTVGMVLEAGHTFAPAFAFDRFGELGVGEFTFELGFVIHM